jgi:hypothetical protein
LTGEASLFAQRLDYLGIPFRCSFCRRTGHLRRDCSKHTSTEPEVDSSEEVGFNGYDTQPEDVAEESPPHQQAMSPDLQADTLVSKIKLLCPSLYNTLSAWERLKLNSQASNSQQPVSTENPTDLPLSPPIPANLDTLASPNPPLEPLGLLPRLLAHSSPPSINPSPLSDPSSSQPPADSALLEDDPTPPPGYTEQPFWLGIWTSCFLITHLHPLYPLTLSLFRCISANNSSHPRPALAPHPRPRE